MDNPSSTILAAPRMRMILVERSAPMTPEMIAKVVTAPSIPP